MELLANLPACVFRERRAQVAVFILVGVLLASSILLYFFVFSSRSPSVAQVACLKDSDCVPAVCCHASECVPKSRAPDCSGVVCTAAIIPGTIDEGQCKCKQNKCVLEIRR
ncbi:hypothetical protein D6817_03475 [Candidatus Pacearchaeota archaeon]|nr:MAG: hypothetical protein D6817_03475 [Candidatus Pacearchaeota archaeon]